MLDLSIKLTGCKKPNCKSNDIYMPGSVLGWWDARHVNFSNITSWPDYSSNANHITLTGFTGASGSKWESATPPYLDADGITNKGVLSKAGLIPANGECTIFVWCKMPEGATKQIIYLTDSANTSSGYMGVSTGNVYYKIYDNAAGSKIMPPVPNIAVSANSWYFMAYTHKARVVTGYLNGVITQAQTLAADSKAIEKIKLFTNNGEAAFIDGSLSIVGVYNKELSADEIKTLYNRECQRFGLTQI